MLKPLLTKIKIHQQTTLLHHNFYPTKNNIITTKISPITSFNTLQLNKHKNIIQIHKKILLTNIPHHITKHKITTLTKNFSLHKQNIHNLPHNQKPNNTISLKIKNKNITKHFFIINKKHINTKIITTQLIKKIKHYLTNTTTIKKYLTNQLILPITLTNTKKFTITHPSYHLLTNITIIKHFLPIQFNLIKTNNITQINIK